MNKTRSNLVHEAEKRLKREQRNEIAVIAICAALIFVSFVIAGMFGQP